MIHKTLICQVIEEAGNDLYNGFVNQDIPRIDASLIMYLVLGSATVLKVGLLMAIH